MLEQIEVKRYTVTGRFLSIIINKWLNMLSLSWKGVYIGKGSKILSSSFCIGKGSRINGKITIKGSGKATIGKYCALGDDIRIITGNHEAFTTSIQLALQKRILGYNFHTKEAVIVGNDVWIGDAVIILPGVTIDDGSVIGAGSVVTKSVSPYMIVAGVPATRINERCSRELAAKFRELSWWDWSEETMKLYQDLFIAWENEQEILECIELIQERMDHVSS